jgi:TolA-binding protein
MSRGLIVTLTGLFAIAATSAALAQPVAPAAPAPPAAPSAPAAPIKRVAPAWQSDDFEWVREMAQEHREQAREVMREHREEIRKAQEEIRKLDVEGLKDFKYDLEGLKAFNFEGLKDFKLEGMKDFKFDAVKQLERLKELKFDGKAFDGKAFGFDVKSQGDLARMFERCDAQRGNPEEQEDRFYDCGRRAIDESQWDRAVDYFTRAAAVKGDRADGALYWKAYSQNRLGQRAEALTTLAELKNGYAKSRWTNDASALEVEVRQRSGQKVDPANTSDDELKLLALNALGDSPEAVPMLERLLAGPQSPKLKERALFVLAQNQNPAARAVVIKIAKGGGNPELQYRAIQYVGRTRTPESREVLAQAYGTTADPGVKRMIIRTYMEAQDRERLLALARTETDPALRVAAVRELGNMRAGTELSELYLRETSAEVKKQILRAMANGGSIDRLITVVDSEKDPELKRTAIRTIGTNRDTGPQLVNFYTKDTNAEVRKAVIDALFTQGNATALVTIARKETDIELKKNLVNRLGNMRDNPEAKQYLIELIGK